jgi:putative acetyltransferase
MPRVFTEASIMARPFFERNGFQVIAAQIVEKRGQKFQNFRMEKFFVPGA